MGRLMEFYVESSKQTLTISADDVIPLSNADGPNTILTVNAALFFNATPANQKLAKFLNQPENANFKNMGKIDQSHNELVAVAKMFDTAGTPEGIKELEKQGYKFKAVVTDATRDYLKGAI